MFDFLKKINFTKIDKDADEIEQHGINIGRILLYIVLVIVLAYAGNRAVRLADKAEAGLAALNEVTIPTANAALKKQITYIEDQENSLDDEKKQLIAPVTRSLNNFEQFSAWINNGLKPQLSYIAANVRNGTGELQPLLKAGTNTITKLGEVADESKNTVKSITNLVDNGSSAITELRSKFGLTLDVLTDDLQELNKTEKNLTVIFEPAAWEKMRDAGADSMVQVDGILKNVNEVSGYVKGRIIPKPHKYSKNKFISGLQHVGWYTLDIIKTAPSAAIAVVKLAATSK